MCWICTVSPKRHTNWLCRGLFFPLSCCCRHTFSAKFADITLCCRHVSDMSPTYYAKMVAGWVLVWWWVWLLRYGCGGGWWVRLLAKKERNIIIIPYDLSYYPILSQNKSKCTTATVSCVLQKKITCTLVHLICFLLFMTQKNKNRTTKKELQYTTHVLKNI